MTFRDNLNRICKERGTNLTTVLTKLGYSSSKTTAINNGSIPKEATLIELARALNCSVMDFFEDDGGTGETKVTPENEDEADVLSIFREMSREDKHKLLARLYAYQEALTKND